MIDFTKQLQKFLMLTETVRVSSNAQCLYMQILNLFHNKFYPTELQIDNIRLHNLTRLSRHQIIDARNELQALSLIKYTNGSGSASGKYVLIDIANLKLNSIIQTSSKTAKTSTVSDLIKSIDTLPTESKIWANYVLQTLNKAISNNQSGVYNNFYTTSQMFLNAENTLKYNTLNKLIILLRNKPDIENKESYILTVIANAVKQQKQASM